MAEKILLLHEKALRYRFDFDQTSNDFKAIHIWDDAYYRMQRYSFKRLVFIYETLLELPLEIIHGNTQRTKVRKSSRMHSAQDPL